MAFSLFYRPINLPLGDRVLHCRTPDRFDAALSGKTSTSAVALTILGGMPDDALQREDDAMCALQQRVADALAGHAGPGSEVDRLFDELEPSLITEDHDWRAILAALKHAGPASRDYRRAALGKFLEYLTSSVELIRTLRASRRDARAGDGDEPGPRQALLFDLDELSMSRRAERHTPAEAFFRLPKGDPISVPMDAGQSLTLLLASYPFTLVAGSPCLLIDTNGNDVGLRPGRNVIGRSLRSDVALDGVFRAVSRRHLVIEIDDAGVTLTDISTLGTFLPRPDAGGPLH